MYWVTCVSVNVKRKEPGAYFQKPALYKGVEVKPPNACPLAFFDGCKCLPFIVAQSVEATCPESHCMGHSKFYCSVPFARLLS